MKSMNLTFAWLAAFVVSPLVCIVVAPTAIAQQAAGGPVATPLDNIGSEKMGSDSFAPAPTLAPVPTFAPPIEAVQALDTQRPASSTFPATVMPTHEHQRGYASWYGPGFHGKMTASGQRYDMHAMTAAHRTLPFGTLVLVKSLITGREVLVRITDRGPFVAGRILDLSRAAAIDLGMLTTGINQVVLLIQNPASRAAPRSAALTQPKNMAARLQR